MIWPLQIIQISKFLMRCIGVWLVHLTHANEGHARPLNEGHARPLKKNRISKKLMKNQQKTNFNNSIFSKNESVSDIC